MTNARKIISNQNTGFFHDLLLQIKLILRLISDRRVNLLLKLLPIAAAIYVISPVDLIPGAVLPFIGALDDAVVIWLGTTLFLSLCPEDIVQEHTKALKNVIPGTWQDAIKPEDAGDVIDAEVSENPGKMG
jgi:uncharacterized membrane protein YkvA (DUF1232 family)